MNKQLEFSFSEPLPENAVKKPWGYYIDYFRDKQVVFKKLVINPGHSISLQEHSKRLEYWYVAEGTATIIRVQQETDRYKKHIDEYTINANMGRESMHFVGVRETHRIVNQDEIYRLVIYEMQVADEGGCCSESDIKRYEDNYDRK